MSGQKTRVCVIGAGPSGMAALYNFGKLPRTSAPEIVCFEKQNKWGGQWNYNWMTGTDDKGEPLHAGMYKQLWSNGPKECLEFPDYTFEKHFGKPIPSFPPRAVLRDYLEGRYTQKGQTDLKQFIRFDTLVQSVVYNKTSDDFTVIVKNFNENKTYCETFNYVIVANGIFNFPKKPYIEGIETFEGRILHSHDFRDAKEFKGQTILCIGASYSAEDISMQCVKFGAKHAICTWRSRPMNFKWPKGVEEREPIQCIKNNTVHFRDGSSAEVDAIIYCTGYLYNFPFLADDLRLSSSLSVFPDNLYKGVLWVKGGNNRLFYIGMQDQYFSYTMFDAQALWICRYITGELKNEPVSMDEMTKDVAKWRSRAESLKDRFDDIRFQGDYISDVSKPTGYNMDASVVGKELFLQWETHKYENIATYRDHSFCSIFTKNASPTTKTPWFQNMDDSLETFLKE